LHTLALRDALPVGGALAQPAASVAAARLGLPLEVLPTGESGLADALARLVSG
jgi:hypothetical protein